MNDVFEKEELPTNSRENLIQSYCKKSDKSECGNYRDLGLISVGSKLLSIMKSNHQCNSANT